MLPSTLYEHHVTYPGPKFEIVTSDGLGGDTFTRNVTDGRMHRLTDRPIDGRRADFGTKLIYPFFLKKKADITTSFPQTKVSPYV